MEKENIFKHVCFRNLRKYCTEYYKKKSYAIDNYESNETFNCLEFQVIFITIYSFLLLFCFRKNSFIEILVQQFRCFLIILPRHKFCS